MKHRLFVGSSTESLDVAYAIQESLDRFCEVTVWSQGVFEPSRYSMDALVDVLDGIDFGVFVFAPDDIVRIGGAESVAARDNVVFELGLFIGRLGRERSFIIIPSGHEDFHIPTHLLGLTPATYDPNRVDRKSGGSPWTSLQQNPQGDGASWPDQGNGTRRGWWRRSVPRGGPRRQRHTLTSGDLVWKATLGHSHSI